MVNGLYCKVCKKIRLLGGEKMNIDINDLKELQMFDKFNLSNVVNDKYLNKSIYNIIDSGINYIIKSMPINKSVQNVIIEIKDVIKESGLKEAIKESLNIALKEGLNFIKLPKNIIESGKQVMEIITKGGFKYLLVNSIELLFNSAIKSRILPIEISKFIERVKDYIFSEKFSNKFQGLFNQIDKQKEVLNSRINSWNEAYNNKNIQEMDKSYRIIKQMSGGIVLDSNISKTIDTIKNITKLFKTKKDTLNNYELELCAKI